MGNASPSCCVESDFLMGRLAHLATALARGKTQASQERSTVGEEEIILPGRWMAFMGLCHGQCGLRYSWAATFPGIDGPDYAVRQDLRQRPSIRSSLGRLLHPPSHQNSFHQTARCQCLVLKNGLSRMRGDSHVRFKGAAAQQCAAATRPLETAHSPCGSCVYLCTSVFSMGGLWWRSRKARRIVSSPVCQLRYMPAHPPCKRVSGDPGKS